MSVYKYSLTTSHFISIIRQHVGMESNFFYIVFDSHVVCRNIVEEMWLLYFKILLRL